MKETMTAKIIAQIRNRIADLSATKPVMVGSDSGTHGMPGVHHIYETITGDRYATYSFAGSNATRCTEAEAKRDTDGRIRHFAASESEIRAKAKELKSLKLALYREGLDVVA